MGAIIELSNQVNRASGSTNCIPDCVVSTSATDSSNNTARDSLAIVSSTTAMPVATTAPQRNVRVSSHQGSGSRRSR